ncbi:reverse transcriptase [Caerostris darwini]|uniref:Reverse transcriptase n=1 Tax=Caerostris darwini TaxID=1538125 RepID=A0AAV4VCI4_9ARAC|nr:reverse transcriptase [Caerostris darwini]
MCERTFEHGVPKAVTDSCTKFNYCVAPLPSEAAAKVRDVIVSLDTTEPYIQLENALIEHSGESSTQEIRKLLSGEYFVKTFSSTGAYTQILSKFPFLPKFTTIFIYKVFDP